MKPLLRITDWIYRHAYETALQSPSKKDANDIATMFVAAAAAMHITLAAFVVAAFQRMTIPTPVIVGFVVICIAISSYHYTSRGNGQRVIERAKKEGIRTKIWVAVLLIIEVCFLPILSTPLFIVINRIR